MKQRWRSQKNWLRNQSCSED